MRRLLAWLADCDVSLVTDPALTTRPVLVISFGKHSHFLYLWGYRRDERLWW